MILARAKTLEQDEVRHMLMVRELIGPGMRHAADVIRNCCAVDVQTNNCMGLYIYTIHNDLPYPTSVKSFYSHPHSLVTR